MVVDHLSESQKQDIGVACLYLNHKEAESQAPTKLLAGLWRQLILGRDISSQAQKLYHQHHEKATTPSLDEIQSVLCSAVREFVKVYIIVDAIDEYSNDQRQVLLKRLAAIGPSAVNLMITARPHIPHNSCFPNIKTLEIRARDEDIQRYVDTHIEMSSRLSKHVQGRPYLRQEIHAKIRRTVDGM
jgi:hypothetical protein